MTLLFDVLKQLPLLTVVIWLALAAFQIYRDRIHTWTETCFLFASFFTGLYALSDFFLFTASSIEGAKLAARFSLSTFTLVGIFFFLFTQVYVRRLKRAYLLAFISVPIFFPFIWGRMLQDVTYNAEAGIHFVTWELATFGMWLALIMAFGIIGVINLYRVDRIVRAQSGVLGRRTRGLFFVFTIVFFLGTLTNGLINATQNTTIPPPFSTLLAIPGLFVGRALYPGTRERISEVMRRFKARNYTIESGFLVFNDGTLVGSSSRSGHAEIDRDLFSATLDVIQNFMRTSFPFLAGKSLKTIAHGDLKILIERGRQCYLAIVLIGEENDLLRRQIRDELLGFEERNRDVLVKWRGVQEEAVGVDEMFRRLFEPATMFPK